VRHADGVLLVYDITDTSTLVAIRQWLDVAKRYCHPDAVILLVGNKVELRDENKKQVSWKLGEV